MNLLELVKRHPAVSLATPLDNDEILSFFHQLPMKGEGFALRYDRSPDFFAFLRLQSQEHFVFLLRDRGQLEGIGTLVLRNGCIDGELCSVGYLGDLRVKPGRRNAVNWRRFYRDLMEKCDQVDELRGVRHFQTAVIDSNLAAQKALIENHRHGYVYHLLRHYEMINVLARKPWRRNTGGYAIRRAGPEDLEKLQTFWRSGEMKKQFGQPELLTHALNSWSDFSLDRILIASQGEEIRGMTALWSPRRAKRIVLVSLPGPLRLLTRGLRLLRPFPREGEELNPLYLSLLSVSGPEVVSEFLHHVIQQNLLGEHHLISLCGFPHQGITAALADFWYDRTPMALYQVYDGARPELRLTAPEAGFEMALV